MVVSQEEVNVASFVPGQKKDTSNPFPQAYQPKVSTTTKRELSWLNL